MTSASDTTSAFDSQPGAGPDTAPRTLRRCPHHRMLGGVAAGLADYLGVDLMIVRLAWVVLGLVGGLAGPLYVAAWLLIPEEDAPTSIAEDLFHRFAGA